MGQILKLAIKANEQGWDLKRCRNENGLSVAQAAAALNISIASYERMEQGVAAPPQQIWVETSFSVYFDQNANSVVGNFVLGAFSLRFARELLGESIEGISERYGYSINSWRKFESNGRILKSEIVVDIESRIKSKMADIAC